MENREIQEFIEISKNQMITIDSIGHALITENGRILIVTNDIFAIKKGDKYYTYHILENGEVVKTNIQYQLKTQNNGK